MVEGSSSTLFASWMTPDPPHGVITGYTIYCSSSSGMLTPFIVSDGSSTTETLQNLNPFTQYSCSISANTSAGEGNRSNIDSATTDEDGKSIIGILLYYDIHSYPIIILVNKC